MSPRNVVSTVTLVLCTIFGVSACGGSAARFIVETRDHQGDIALGNHNLTDAATAYRLALRIAPGDEHARAGLSTVQLQLAARDYTLSKFDDALAALAIAAKYDPQSVRLAELRSEIEQARVKREIVVSNYPTYGDTGLALRKAYAQLRVDSNAIVSNLRRFDYTYDSTELVKAIRASSALGEEVARLTTRLQSYRQLVESGSPDRNAEAPLAPAASLLPLP